MGGGAVGQDAPGATDAFICASTTALGKNRLLLRGPEIRQGGFSKLNISAPGKEV